MKNILIFSTLLIISFFLSGCSSSYAVHLTNSMEIREMNEQLKGRIVTIESKNGMDIWAKDVNISKDSISWFNWQQESTTWASKESKASIPPFGTFTIVIKNHFRGALEGLGLGLTWGDVGGQFINSDSRLKLGNARDIWRNRRCSSRVHWRSNNRS